MRFDSSSRNSAQAFVLGTDQPSQIAAALEGVRFEIPVDPQEAAREQQRRAQEQEDRELRGVAALMTVGIRR